MACVNQVDGGGRLSHNIYIYRFVSYTVKKTYNSVNYSPVKLEKRTSFNLLSSLFKLVE